MLEKLAKLTPKTPTLTPIGGKPEITWEDVAASLPKALCKHAQLYIYAKFVDPHNCGNLVELSKEAARNHFKLTGHKADESTINLLGVVALGIALSPGHCKACNGSGRIPHRKGFSVCESCGGTGRAKQLSNRALADQLGVSEKKAKHFWRHRLNDLLADYLDYELIAEESLGKGLKN